MFAQAVGKREIEFRAIRVHGTRRHLIARGVGHHVLRAFFEFLVATQDIAELVLRHIGLETARVQLDSPHDIVVGAIRRNGFLHHGILNFLRIFQARGAVVLARAAPNPLRRIADVGNLLTIFERIERRLLHRGFVLNVVITFGKRAELDGRALPVDGCIAFSRHRVAAFINQPEGASDKIEVRPNDVLNL